MNTPLVSIIIPTWNRAHLIGETLASVQAQTYPHWECIVVDDGSTDNTEEVMQEWLKDERFKFYKRHREPKGAPTCRNIGLEKAVGELIIFFDSDDIMLDYCLKNRVKYFEEDEKLDLLISYQKRMENGKESFYVNVPNEIHPLIRFYSIAANIDIPWINNSTTTTTFLSKNKIVWNESMRIFQDIQFNINLLSFNPFFKWSKDKFDSYWVFDSNNENIGSKNFIEFHSKLELFKAYRENLKNLYVPENVQISLKRQWKYILWEFAKKSITNRNQNLNLFTSFFYGKESGFGFSTKLLLRILTIIERRKRRFYVHRLLRRKVCEFLDNKYKPVIKSGKFLKISTLN